MTKIKTIVRGPALSASGYGEHCRFLLRSIWDDERFDIFLENINWGALGYQPENSSEREKIYKLITKTKRYFASGGVQDFDLSLQVSIPNEFQRFAKYNIGVTAGIEADRIAPEWIEKCNLMDKIITISEHSRKGLADTIYTMINNDTQQQHNIKIMTPVRVVPYPVPNLDVDEMDLDLNTSFNFLLVALWGERKNIPNTIRWFIETFIDNPDVGLIVKTAIRSGCTVDRITMEETLTQFLQRWPDRKCKVYLLHGRLTNGEKNYLYNNEKVHALVSITHGEGFGLPIFEAACNALPIVAPNWSGQVDFLNHPKKDKKGKEKIKPYFSKVDYEISEVQKSSVWKGVIPEDARWCYPKENSFKEKIRDVHKNYEMRKSQAKKLQEIIFEKYDSEKIHNLFLEEILSVVDIPENSKVGNLEQDVEEMFSSLSSVGTMPTKEVEEKEMKDNERASLLSKPEWQREYNKYHKKDTGMNPETAKEILLEVDEILKSLDVEYYITCGTALGWHRDSAFIPWDDEIDIDILSDVMIPNMEKMREKFIEQGFVVRTTHRGNTSKMILYKKGIKVATGAVYDGEDGYHHAKFYKWPSKFYENAVKHEFAGRNFLLPGPLDEYLTYMYGDWKTTIKSYDPNEYVNLKNEFMK